MPTRAQDIRKEVLLQVYAAPRLTFSPEQIHRAIHNAGLDGASKSEVLDAIFFLRGQGFLSAVTSAGSGEVRYQITSAGILEYENAQ